VGLIGSSRVISDATPGRPVGSLSNVPKVKRPASVGLGGSNGRRLRNSLSHEVDARSGIGHALVRSTRTRNAFVSTTLPPVRQMKYGPRSPIGRPLAVENMSVQNPPTLWN